MTEPEPLSKPPLATPKRKTLTSDNAPHKKRCRIK